MCPACVRALFLLELCSKACVPMCPAAFGGRVLDVSLMCPGMRAGARVSSLYVNRFFGSLLKTISFVFVVILTSQRLRKLSEVVCCSRGLWLWCGGLSNYAQPGFG